MPADRETLFLNAERQLRQGKVREALDEFRRVAEDSPRDPLILNRIGDVLARAARNTEAIEYFERAAAQFGGSGFYPKAVAVLKKVIKIDPGRLQSLVQLGELHLKQKHPGEAKACLLPAAQTYLRSGDVARAREVYEKLVAADPDDPEHRFRLAEARAAEGKVDKAGEEFLALAAALGAQGRHDAAESAFRRAQDLLPGSAKPALGLARAMLARHKGPEATAVLDDVLRRFADDPAVLGACYEAFEAGGLAERVDSLLTAPSADRIPEDAVERVLRGAIRAGLWEGPWARLSSAIDRWRATGRGERAAQVLDRVARIEPIGFLPAIEKLWELRRDGGTRGEQVSVLERLVRCVQARGGGERLDPLMETLRGLEPGSPLLHRRAGDPEPPAAPAGPEKTASRAPEAPPADDVPAVPLSAADDEFVSGHLTEAEVFEKYGLMNEALQQLRELVQRFPGHVRGVERLAALLRARPDRKDLRDALVTLSLARRAAGDPSAARLAASEAAAAAPLDPPVRARLEQLGLVDRPRPVAPPPAAPPVPVAPAAPASVPDVAAPPAAAKAARAAEDDFEIVFDDEVATPVAVAPTPPSAPPPARRAVRTPPPDVLEEVAFYLEQGMREDARARLEALRTLGFAGAEMDALAERCDPRPAPSPEPVAPPEPEIAAEADEPAPGDEDDLSILTEALQDLEPAGAAAADDPEAHERSVGEVVGEFRKQVQRQVAGDDHRTHYDLGIAYKEMGLIDEAIDAFRTAAASPAYFLEACSMIALIHRERGEAQESAHWYREALRGAPEDVPRTGVRYDLAELLLEAGDTAGALSLFREVLAADPDYRDVADRVAEIERARGR